MSTIQSNTTLRTEDYPSEQSWIGLLLFPLNQFITQVTQQLNGNITFGDNIPGVTHNLFFVYGGASDFPKPFKWTLNLPPTEVRLCSATENNVPIAVIFAWGYSQGQISITNVYKITNNGATGLTSGSSYRIIFRAQL